MAEIEAKLKKLGLELPAPLKTPPGLKLPFKPVIVRGKHVYISGHAPQNADGSIAGPMGKLGKELTVEQGYQSAKLVALSILGDLKRAIGDLDRVAAWLRVLGMVNVAPGFNQTTPVINGFSDLILELYGPERGAHTRSAVGMAALPLDISVEIEAEVELAS
jgi:enamine deaminase RidA (YjgF/YER057c/UK114 family)